jgi:hypothetical protein
LVVKGKAVTFEELYEMHPAELLFQEKEDQILPDTIISSCTVDTLPVYNEKQKKTLPKTTPRKSKRVVLKKIDHFFVERSYSDRSRSNKPIKIDWESFLEGKADLTKDLKRPVAKTRGKTIERVDKDSVEKTSPTLRRTSNNSVNNTSSKSTPISILGKKGRVMSKSKTDVSAKKEISSQPASASKSKRKTPLRSKPSAKKTVVSTASKPASKAASDSIFDFPGEELEKSQAEEDCNDEFVQKSKETSPRRASKRRSVAKKAIVEESGDSASEDENFAVKPTDEVSDDDLEDIEDVSDEDLGNIDDVSDGSETPDNIFITSTKTKIYGRKIISRKRYLF